MKNSDHEESEEDQYRNEHLDQINRIRKDNANISLGITLVGIGITFFVIAYTFLPDIPY